MVIRVAVVNGDELVVRGLDSMLKPRAEFEHVDLSSQAAIDIVLVDTLALTGDRDRTLARLVADPRVGKVVIYTWNFQPWSAGQWIRQGASGYLSKSLPSAILVEALEAVHAGRTIVAPAQRRSGTTSEWTGQEHGLTQREAEVLSLITTGLSNAQIARQTCLSINSIKAYIRSGYRKINVESRSQAVLWGLAHGLGGDAHRPRPAADPRSQLVEAQDLVATQAGQAQLSVVRPARLKA